MSGHRSSQAILKAIDTASDPLESAMRETAEQVALLSVQAIAIIVRDALPEADGVMLYYQDIAGTQALPHGFTAADGSWIGYDGKGNRTGPAGLHMMLHEVCDDIGWPYCANLTAANEDTWTRFASREPAAGLPAGTYWRLSIDRALTAAARLLPPGTPACSPPRRRRSAAAANPALPSGAGTGHQAGGDAGSARTPAGQTGTTLRFAAGMSARFIRGAVPHISVPRNSTA